MSETSAETIRRAAKLMRERAEKAHPGPWDFETEVGGFGPVGCVMVPFSPHYPGARSGLTSYTPLGTQNASTAEYIASMQPSVAMALAEVFDKFAWMGELDPELFGRVGCDEVIALARVYLGEVTA